MQSRRSVLVEVVCVVAAATVIAILWTWPLVLHLSRGGRAIDSPFEAWTIDWVQFAIRHPTHLYNADIFAPTRGTLAFSAPLIGVALPMLPFRWLGLSPLAEYNAALIVSTAASAVAAYGFGRLVLHSRAAASVVGVAFAFGPFPYVMATHLQMTARAGIPAAAAAAWWLVDRLEAGRRIRGPVVAVVAVMAWQTSVSLYPTAYALLAVVIVLGVRWRARYAIRMGVAAVAIVVAVLVVAIPHLLVAHSYPDADRAVPGGLYGAHFFATASRLVDRHVLRQGQPLVYESAAFPGFAVLALGAAGVTVSVRKRGPVVMFGLVATIAALVLAIGTAPHGWRSYAPYRLVWDLVPGSGALRAFARVWVVGLLGLGVLGGLAIDTVTERAPRLALALAAVVCVAIVAEGYAPWTDVSAAPVQPVDTALARIHAPGSVLYLPIASPRRPASPLELFAQAGIVYRTTVHHRPTVNGYSGYFPPWSGTSVDLADDLPCARGRQGLWRAGVRYIVVPTAIGPPWAALADPATARPLRRIGTYGTETLYQLPRPVPHDGNC